MTLGGLLQLSSMHWEFQQLWEEEKRLCAPCQLCMWPKERRPEGHGCLMDQLEFASEVRL